MTTVTAQVKDANGTLYNSCRYSATLVNLSTSTLTLGGTALPDQFKQVTGTQCDANGNLSTKLVANTALIPNNSQWRFTICDSNGANCFNFQLAITGTTQDITTQVQAAAVILPISNTTLLSGNNNFTGNNTHSGAETFNTINGSALRGQTYDAWGDSITFGVGASVPANSYASLVAAARGYTLVNHGVSSDQLTDMGTHVYAYTPLAGGIHSILIGQNDTCTQGDSTPSALWLNALEANAAYLMANNKLTGQAVAVTKTGTWTSSTVSPFGVQTSTNNDTASFTVNGTTVLIGMHAVLSNSSSVSVSVDGANVGTYTPSIVIASNKSVSHGPYLIRIPNLPNKPHTVVLTAVISSGTLYFDWAAGNLNQTGSVFLLSPYRSSISAVSVANCRKQWERASRELVGDGLRLFPVDTQAACDDVSGSALCNKFDGTHPDDAGHKIIANSVISAMDNFAWMHPAPTQPDPRGTTLQRNGLGYAQDFLLPFNLSANSSVKVTVDLSPDSAVDGTPKAFSFTAEVSTSFQNRQYALYSGAGVASSPGTLGRVFVQGTEKVVLGEILNVDNTTIQFTLANINTGSNQRGVLRLHFFGNDDYSVRNVWLGTEYATTFTTPAVITPNNPFIIAIPSTQGTTAPFQITGNASNASSTSLATITANGANEQPLNIVSPVFQFRTSSGGNPTLTPIATGTATTSVGSFGYRFQGNCGNGTTGVLDTYTPQVTYGAGANPPVTYQVVFSGGCSGARNYDTTNWTNFLANNIRTNTASNTDAAGTIAISASTTGTYTFAKTYTSSPICILTPTTDPTAVGVYWATTSTTVLTANVKTSGTITFNYQCVGRN